MSFSIDFHAITSRQSLTEPIACHFSYVDWHSQILLSLSPNAKVTGMCSQPYRPFIYLFIHMCAWESTSSPHACTHMLLPEDPSVFRTHQTRVDLLSRHPSARITALGASFCKDHCSRGILLQGLHCRSTSCWVLHRAHAGLGHQVKQKYNNEFWNMFYDESLWNSIDSTHFYLPNKPWLGALCSPGLEVNTGMDVNKTCFPHPPTVSSRSSTFSNSPSFFPLPSSQWCPTLTLEPQPSVSPASVTHWLCNSTIT